MGQPLSYEPESTNNIATLAARENRDPREVVYELMLEKMAGLSFGMTDRGTLEPGTKADVNVIDYDNLRVSYPEMIYDLPAGMPRLMQTATGYENTFVSGEVVQENGKDTGARPGRVVRST
jgi:N-acyl-D-amino-acid deacylase